MSTVEYIATNEQLTSANARVVVSLDYYFYEVTKKNKVLGSPRRFVSRRIQEYLVPIFLIYIIL